MPDNEELLSRIAALEQQMKELTATQTAIHNELIQSTVSNARSLSKLAHLVIEVIKR
jgi:hypothetical protein